MVDNEAGIAYPFILTEKATPEEGDTFPKNGSLNGTLSMSPAGGVEVRFNGYGDYDSVPGCGSVLYMELHEGKLKVYVYPDINSQEPEKFEMEAARESNRVLEDDPNKPETPWAVVVSKRLTHSKRGELRTVYGVVSMKAKTHEDACLKVMKDIVAHKPVIVEWEETLRHLWEYIPGSFVVENELHPSDVSV